MSGPLQLEFVTSAVNIRDLPESPIEVAVVGRSRILTADVTNSSCRGPDTYLSVMILQIIKF